MALKVDTQAHFCNLEICLWQAVVNLTLKILIINIINQRYRIAQRRAGVHLSIITSNVTHVEELLRVPHKRLKEKHLC